MKTIYLLACVALIWPCGSANGRTWFVTEDGTGDVTTIQAGVDSATAGDTVLVACGTYEGPVWLEGKSGICLRSETGQANCVVLQPDQSGNHYNAGIWCWNVDATTEIEGFKVINSCWSGDGGGFHFYYSAARLSNCEVKYVFTFAGGGVFCEGKYGDESPTVTDCTFRHNVGYGLYGSVIFCDNSSPTISRCTFYDNIGTWGMIHCVGQASEPLITECTLMCNGDNTDAIGCSGGATPVIDRTIIAYNRGGRAVGCEDANSVPVISCTDIFDNAGGDWIEYIADQYGVRDNGSEDPLFCSVTSGQECPWLQDCSPCLDWAGCGLIGSKGLGCECGTGGPSRAEPTSWGLLKSMYK